MYSIILLAISTPVAPSMPSNPGEEFTSITKGPLSDCNKSTPAIPNPNFLHALIAVALSSGVKLMREAVPPRCKLLLNSPSLVSWRLLFVHQL